MFTIMAIKIQPRNSLAPKVQEILTSFGDLIQTRLGLHGPQCGEEGSVGLILLNLLHDKESEIEELSDKLNKLDGVKAKILLI